MVLVNKNRTVITCIAAALFILLSLHGSAFGQANEAEDSGFKAPQAKYTAKGVQGCLECHAGERMTLVADTVHGNKDNPHTPYANQGCESCHGPGSFHSSRARGGVGFPALLSFRTWESTELHNQACMNCHEKDMGELKGMTWKGSVHESRGMTCVYCHQSHVTFDKVKDHQLQRERCSKCHSRQIATHTGGEDLLKLKKCSECHKVHDLTATVSSGPKDVGPRIDDPQSDARRGDPRIETWGSDWPEYVDMYLETRDMSKPTPFGGNVPYSKLIRFPGKTLLWAGYAFALDFNEERGHYFSQIDQMETKRNDRAFLNANGLANFKGQPSACMNCHSGWAPSLVEQMGWENFNRTPYWTTIEQLRKEHGHGTSGAELGSACADCHHPDDLSLRVSRRAYIDAMVERGYLADPKTGLKGTQEEMRDHVCQQCHVEYYFKGADNVLTYPWSQWPKGQPLRIEMIEAYYEIARDEPGGFQADWIHAVTKAPMLKMQHPEAELASSGKHAMIMGCVDCHMPEIQRNGKTVTDHTLNSPLNKLESCRKCHSDVSEKQLYQKVYDIQVRNVAALLRAEKGILALIEDIAMVRRELGTRDPFAQIAADGEREAAITKELAEVLEFHRRSSMRWDFIGASNSTGAHSPAEALRVLEQAVSLARDGQALLKAVAARHGIDLVLTSEPTLPAAPAVLEPGNIVGSLPPEITREADRAARDRLRQ